MFRYGHMPDDAEPLPVGAEVGQGPHMLALKVTDKIFEVSLGVS